MHEIQSRTALRRFASLALQDKAQAEATAQATLPEGLALRFERAPDGYLHWRFRILLMREHFWPTEDEVEGCCLAFQVPPSVNQRREESTHAHPKSGRRLRLHIVELSWSEARDEEQRHAVTGN